MAMPKPKNREEADQLRAALAEFDRDQAKAAHAAALERFAPLRDLVESTAFKEVRDKLASQRGEFEDVDAINVHLAQMPGFMDRLKGAVEAALMPPAGIAADEAPAA